MRKYKVTITETLQSDVWVEAESPQEAERILRERYNKAPEAHILDDSDYLETEIECFDMIGTEINN